MNKIIYYIIVLLIIITDIYGQGTKINNDKDMININPRLIPQNISHSRADEDIIFYEDFSDESFPPSGWSLYTLGHTQREWIRDVSTYYSPPACARSEWSSGGNVLDNWLIMPKIEIPEDSVLSFYQSSVWAIDYTYHGIYVSEGGGNPDSEDYGDFHELIEIGMPSLGWREFTYCLSEYADREIYIAFVYQGDNGATWFIDDIGIYRQTDYEFTLMQITPDSMVQIGESLFYQLRIKNTGMLPDDYLLDTEGVWIEGLYMDQGETPIEIPLSISPGEETDIFIEILVPSDTLPWTENIDSISVWGTDASADIDLITTAVNWYFQEDFSDGLPANWNIVEMGDPTDENIKWHYFPDENAMRHFWTDINVWADNWLITPPINIDRKEEGDIRLRFLEIGIIPWYYEPSWYEYHGVWISNSSGDPALGDFQELAEILPLGSGEGWQLYDIDISDYINGDDIYIAFVYQGEEKDVWDISFIEIYGGFQDSEEYMVEIGVDPIEITEEASAYGEGLYSPGDTVYIGVQDIEHYIFAGWSSDDELEIFDPGSLETGFIMPDKDILLMANYEYFNMEDGPDASIERGDITFEPQDPSPGDTIEINARIRNLGGEAVSSGRVDFYRSIDPNADLILLEYENFGQIFPGDHLDVSILWETEEDIDPAQFVITVVLSDIMPYDIEPDNNSAYRELAPVIDLLSFTAVGIRQRATIRWRTINECNSLGFNLYRINLSTSIGGPVQINDELIEAQGHSSELNLYEFTDFGINRFFDYAYILEAISIYGDIAHYQTNMLRLGLRQIIF